ncbi:MAG TPA: SUMF1/EgtB/PvdO family nonheme iron enzyme, partial [Polyangiaceae bacterium]
ASLGAGGTASLGAGGIAGPGGNGNSTMVSAAGAIELSGGGAGTAATGNVSVDSAGVAGTAGAGGESAGSAGTDSVGGVAGIAGAGGVAGVTGAGNHAGSEASGVAGVGNTHVPCPATGGPVMVSLPLGYCIDSTEVTRAQYQTWLSSNPPTTGQIPDCTWNTSFTPQGNWNSPSTDPNNPVAYVDWCDAYAYCIGVGKRLCGKIGGGPNAFTDYANATLSQWHAACTSNGVSDYPYGDAYDAVTCNGSESANGATVAVGSMTNCHSRIDGFGGVYDMSGNVYEWEDSCSSAGNSALCRGRGGGFNDTDRGSGSLACDSPLSGIPRDTVGNNIGFRCCAP